jgi:Fur family ferric uptake transcriptional regulator
MKYNTDILIKYIRDKGLRFTKERGKMLAKIMGSRKHFEAEDFLLQLNKKRLKISRPTFYRTLNLFLRSGLISKSNLEDGRVIYENTSSRDHHDHFVCIDCGKMIEFTDPNIERQQDKICRKYGFTAMRHQMHIFGLCDSCRQRTEKTGG